MIDLVSTVQGVLQDARFTTRLTTLNRLPVVCFEDEVLMGFVSIFDTSASLLSDWRATETSLLRRYAPSLRDAGDKAWNVYSIFLCSASAVENEERAVRWIEEDLEQTRKLAACGISNRDDLMRALLPILPLQYQPALEPEDLTNRLKQRIRTIAPKAFESSPR